MHALDGIRVLAFEQAAAAPFGTHLLADMGSEVVKVERPGAGDVIRGWDAAVKGLSSGYVWLNRRKRSVTIDARKPGGRDALQRLADRSDVFRPAAPGGCGAHRYSLARHDALTYAAAPTQSLARPAARERE